MRHFSSFRRGGSFGDDSQPPHQPDPEHFTQVPAIFTQGLSPEQWKALQETYRVAWEKAIRDQPEPPESFGNHYEI